MVVVVDAKRDKEYLKLIKDLAKKSTLDHKVMNEQILELFPSKMFLHADQKNATQYFQKLTTYMMENMESKLIEDAHDDINKIYRVLYELKTTRDNLISTPVRKPIFQRFGKNSVKHKAIKKGVKLTYAEKSEVNQKALDSLISGQKEVFRYDPKSVMDILTRGLQSENVYEKAVSLFFASGSRPTELFDNDVVFTPTDDDKWVVQSTVKKKGVNDKGEANIVPVTKPIVGMTAETFIKEMDDMRWFINSENPQVSHFTHLERSMQI
jgi:hypothetical protein